MPAENSRYKEQCCMKGGCSSRIASTWLIRMPFCTAGQTSLLLHTSLLLVGGCCCSSRLLLQLTAFTPNAVQDLSSVPTLLCLLTL